MNDEHEKTKLSRRRLLAAVGGVAVVQTASGQAVQVAEGLAEVPVDPTKVPGAPASALGQALASMVMIMGYGIIAVPTGIVTAELANVSAAVRAGLMCQACGSTTHDADAAYCKHCGSSLAGACRPCPD